MRILFLTASYGNDKCYFNNVFKSNKYFTKFVKFTSQNFPLNHLKDSRLKSKYPKMIPFDFFPDYDWYFWFDSKFIFNKNFNVDLFLDQLDLGEQSLILCNHPKRKTITEEVNFMEQQINKNNQYLLSRYNLNSIKEQAHFYLNDKTYVDNCLFAMGFFGFRMTAKSIMIEWLEHNKRFTLQDQLSFPYLLNKSNLSYKVVDFCILKNNFFEHISSLRKRPFSYLKYLFNNFLYGR